jgi:ABC-type sugar transport system ATPase subunit
MRRPADALTRGITMVAQETYLALDLTVAENILMGGRQVRSGLAISKRQTSAKASAYLDQLGQGIDPDALVRDLRPDERQMVEIARALSLDARLLILDEPTSSLTDDEVADLFAAIRGVKQRGVAVVFVSHRMKELVSICDELSILRDGEVVSEGPIAEYSEERIVREMVGGAAGTASGPRRDRRTRQDEAVLDIRSLSVGTALTDVDLQVHPGEIVGLAGLVGAGRSELLEAVFGARPVTSGQILIAGEPVTPGVRAAIRRGVGYVPPDRKSHGAVLSMSIKENLLMPATAQRFRLAMPKGAHETSVARNLSSTMSIVSPGLDAAVSSLSGGNQQKVVLGKWIGTQPKLLLLDEPTRGVDVRAKDEIHELLKRAADDGAGVLVSSSENPELLALCDRILVLLKGRVVASLDAATSNEEEITRCAGGVPQ